MMTPVNIFTPFSFYSWPANQEPLAKLNCTPMTSGTRFTWPVLNFPGVLVLASAFDLREPCRIRLFNEMSDWEYILDVGHASFAQRFHISIPKGMSHISISLIEGSPVFWILDDPARLPDSVPAIWPVKQDIDRLFRFFDRLENDCIAEFGWMGGCVLEAFDALAHHDPTERWADARSRWLANFLSKENLAYQDGFGRPQQNCFTIIEAILPMASIARTHPKHPIVDITIEYLRHNIGKDATAEGCYTIAYPSLQMARCCSFPDLEEIAYQELIHRQTKLFQKGNIFLRHHGTHRTFCNWARGISWYLLGHVKCLQIIGMMGKWGPLADHLKERCDWILRHQRPDGLWSNFLNEPHLPADTSGSAGIATALAIAHTIGLCDSPALMAANACWRGLQPHLEIDGWLSGTSPSNKRGEEAQHLPRRVSETFGMGLMGQLAAALKQGVSF